MSTLQIQNLKIIKKLAFGALFALVFLFGFSSHAHAATYYWVGSGGNTSSSANWSSSSGGAGGAGVPGSSDNVFFNSSGTGNATVDSNLTVLSFTISSGYTGTITGSAGVALNLGGPSSTGFSQAAGTLILDSMILTDGVNNSAGVTISGGTYTVTNTTVNGGASNSAPIFTITSATTFNNLTLDTKGNTNTYFNIGSTNQNIVVTGALSIKGYGSILGGLSKNIEARGSISVDTTFDPYSGSTFNLIVDGTGNQTLPSGANIAALGTVTINKSSGTLSFSGTSMTGGNFVFTQGTFDGSTLNTISVNGLSISSNYSGTTFGNSNTVATIGGNTNTIGFAQASGTFIASTVTTSGAGNNASGMTFTAGTYTVATTTLNNTYINIFKVLTPTTFTNLVLYTGSASNKYIDLTGTTQTILVTGALSLTGYGQVYPSSGKTIDVRGNVIVASTYTGSGSNFAFLMDGTSNQNLTANGGYVTYGGSGTFTINKSSGTVTLQSNLALGSAGLSLVAGTLDLNGYSVTGAGAITVSSGATFLGNVASVSGGVIFLGSATLGGSGCLIPANSFGSLTISAGSTCTLSGNVTVSTTTTIGSASTLILNGYALRNKDFVNTAGTLQLNGDENLSMTGTVTNTGTVKYVGNGNGLPDTYTLKDLPYTNLQTAFTDKVDTLAANYRTSINTGLVGYWKLDESTNSGSNTVIDSSGSGNNGTPVNSPTVNSTSLPSLKFTDPRTLTLNGSNQYVNLGTVLNINYPLSLSLWIKRANGGSTFGDIITHGCNGFNLSFYPNSSIAFGKQCVANMVQTNANTITDKTSWHHIAATYDGSTGKIYIDGVLNTSTASSISLSGATTLGIGNDITAPSEYFSGSIDDVRVYNRILTASEVTSLATGYPNEATATTTLSLSGTNTLSNGTFISPQTMTIGSDYTQTGGAFIASSTINVVGNWLQNATNAASTFIRNLSTVNLTGAGGSTQSITSTTTAQISSGLVGLWKFDSGSGSLAVDSSGNGNTGTLTNTPTWTSTVPPVNFVNPYSLSFNSASNQYVTLGKTLSAMNGVSAFSIAFWAKRQALNSKILIGQTSSQNLPNQVVQLWSDGLVYFDVSLNQIGAPIYGYFPQNDTNWHHFVAVFDGTQSGNSGRMKIYLDGVNQTLSFNGTVPSTTGTATGNFEIGRNLLTNVNSYSDGYLDDVRVYNGALNSTEIALLANGYATSTDATAFYNLTKTVTASSTLQFAASSTVTVVGTSTFNGATGQLLSLKSTTPGSQWKFDPQGGLSLSYLNVQDSNNINASTTNVNPTIIGNSYTGLVDGGNNTNWTFNTPTITLVATGTQATTTPLPVGSGSVGGKYMGGAFYGTKNTGTSTVTSIKITQYGNLPTSYISNVQLLYATSTNGLCSTSSTPVSSVNAQLFGNGTSWVTAYASSTGTTTSTTITGSVSIGGTAMCIYTKFSLTGTLTKALLGDTVDLEVTNPSTDIISTGVTIVPSTPVNVQGRSVQTLVNGSVSILPSISLSVASSSISNSNGGTTTLTWSALTNSDNTSTCTASGDNPGTGTWTGSKTIAGNSEVTGLMNQFRAYNYIITCTNQYGTASSSATVTIVDPRIPVTSLSASPSSLSSWGNTSTLTWSVSTTNGYPATGCTSSGVLGSTPSVNGGSVGTGAINSLTAYSLSCGNTYGTTTASISIGLTNTDTSCNSGISDTVCNAGVGTSANMTLKNADGTYTKFQVLSGHLFKILLDANALEISRQDLTDPGVTVTSATFTTIGTTGLQVRLTLQKQTLSGVASGSTFTVQKTFNTTATIRATQSN